MPAPAVHYRGRLDHGGFRPPSRFGNEGKGEKAQCVDYPIHQIRANAMNESNTSVSQPIKVGVITDQTGRTLVHGYGQCKRGHDVG